MKRILSLFLALVAVVGVGFILPVTAQENEITDTTVTEVSAESTEAPTETEAEDTTEEPTQEAVELPSAPVLKSLKNINEGLLFTWNEIENAEGYRIYRRASGEKYWTYLCTVKGNSFTDTDVRSGVYYRYTARSVNVGGFGGYDTVGIYTRRLSPPENIKALNDKDCVKVNWNSVVGASGYRVYRRASGQKSWLYLKTVSNCQYIDKNVTNGVYYRYTVIASYSGVYSGFYADGALLKCVSAPVTQKVMTYPKNIVFHWEKVSGATSYRVYRRAAGEGWKYLCDVKGTTYTDANVVKGKYYRYTVKAVSYGHMSGCDFDGVLVKYMGVNGQTVYGKNAKYLRPGTITNPELITIDEEKWYLTVVHSGYRIPSDYSTNLVYVCGSGERLDSRVAVEYEKMYKAAAKEGVYLTPCSGYRSYSLQERNYNRKVQYYKDLGYSEAQAKVKAATSIMPPGSSEHNLGYAMDIVCVEEYFEDSKQFAWLQENAADYGFIMRYPKDKQHITNVIYEPWHWRYVGVETAQAIKSSGLTLEEYMGLA